MTGYQGDAERNAEAMAGGYYHTGDVATRDEDGYITYVGRTDDVFKACDYKISPFELESVLIEHPAVAEAAVVPAPDPSGWPCPRPTSRWPRDTSPPRRPRSSSSARPRAPRAVPAGSAARVLRPAQDDLRQDPPRRAEAARGAWEEPVRTNGGMTSSPLRGARIRVSRMGDRSLSLSRVPEGETVPMPAG